MKLKVKFISVVPSVASVVSNVRESRIHLLGLGFKRYSGVEGVKVSPVVSSTYTFESNSKQVSLYPLSPRRIFLILNSFSVH